MDLEPGLCRDGIAGRDADGVTPVGGGRLVLWKLSRVRSIVILEQGRCSVWRIVPPFGKQAPGTYGNTLAVWVPGRKPRFRRFISNT